MRKNDIENEKIQTTLRLPEWLKDKLDNDAQELGYSFNELALILIHTGYQYLPRLSRDSPRNR